MRSASRRTVMSSGTRMSTGCLPITCFTSSTAACTRSMTRQASQIELKLMGLELRDLGCFADQAIQAIAFLIDDGHQLPAIISRSSPGSTSGW